MCEARLIDEHASIIVFGRLAKNGHRGAIAYGSNVYCSGATMSFALLEQGDELGLDHGFMTFAGLAFSPRRHRRAHVGFWERLSYPPMALEGRQAERRLLEL